MKAFDIPGYLQGHRFTDEDPRFYDSDNLRFKDLAGFGDLNDLEITVGGPTFEPAGANSRKGLLLDKTCQGRFIPSIPWQGSIILAIRLELLTSGTQGRWPYLFGENATESSNGSIRATSTGAIRNVTFATPAGAISLSKDIGDGNIAVLAFSSDQNTRKGYITADGVTVTESAAAADNGTGNAPAMCGSGVEDPDGIYCRFGDLIGDGSTTAEADLKIYIFEHHFFKGNILTDNLALTKAFMDALNNYYGI